ncbi:hypothetical protein [Mycobacteroides franklinii]|uniref:hypothetical protein n=1 Tax=Mycobacteroides franklinii TaxID=948102 RepID=UPI001F28AE97|nr:hypothetical protein [Mycobacteroides franklinii]
MPSYDPGRGQPPLDQNNGISIYNSAAPQPSQAAQPSQAPVQNQDGSYSRAANGEQQPVNHNAPNNQQLNNNWQRLSDQLNSQPQEQPGQQSGQNSGKQDQTLDQQQDQNRDCDSITQAIESQRGSIVPSPDQLEQARQGVMRRNQKQVEEARKDGRAIRVSSLGTITLSTPDKAGVDQPDATIVLEYARDRALEQLSSQAMAAAGLAGQCSNQQLAAEPLNESNQEAAEKGYLQDNDHHSEPTPDPFHCDLSHWHSVQLFDSVARQRAAFQALVGHEPITASDWQLAKALDVMSSEGDLGDANIAVGRITPHPDLGLVQVDAFIKDAKVYNPPFSSAKGDNRGFKLDAAPSDSRVAFLIDYVNGFIVARQNPSVNADTGEAKTGTPDVDAAQLPTGEIFLKYDTADPWAIIGESASKYLADVHGAIVLQPTLDMPRFGGEISSYPWLEINQWLPADIIRNIKNVDARVPDLGPFGNLTAIPPQSIGDTNLLRDFDPSRTRLGSPCNPPTVVTQG